MLWWCHHRCHVTQCIVQMHKVPFSINVRHAVLSESNLGKKLLVRLSKNVADIWFLCIGVNQAQP